MKKIWSWFWKIAAIGFALLFIYQIWVFVHLLWWIKFNPSTTAFMESRLAIMREVNPDAKLQYQWVPYAKISNNLKSALVAAEDANFVDHEGFDWEGIQKAYEKDLKKGRIVAGGSTISQQLAKNLFLSGRRSPFRKMEEAAITVMMEAVMDKERIFEIYLNVIEWGDGVFGAEAASKHYYRISASQLSAAQAAKLAAMVPNPRYYDKHQNAHGLMKKAGIILSRMNAADIP